jgi:hypothetical protein
MTKYIFIFFATLTFAQVPFSKSNSKNTFAIKALPYVNLLDGGYGSISGIEKGFLKNQSFGVKFIYNWFTPHTEIKNEEGNYEPGNYTNKIDRSYIFEYKYYFNFDAFRQKSGKSFYTSILYKTGVKTTDNDVKFPHDFYFQKVNYNYFGPAIGCAFVVDGDNSWTIDTQIAYLFGKKKVSTRNIVNNLPDVLETYKTDYIRFDIVIAYNFDW